MTRDDLMITPLDEFRHLGIVLVSYQENIDTKRTLADSGVDTETIMKIVGHSSVEMFLRYRTIKAETLDAAMTRMNTLITRHENAARQLPGIAAL